jgi:hypothetical protein
MQSVNDNFFLNVAFNIGTDSVFNYLETTIPSIPIITANFVVDNALNKTIDNEGNYWIT